MDEDNDARRKVAQFYMEHIKNLYIVLPTVEDWQSNVFHIFPIRCKQRDALQTYLLNNGVQTLIHYPIPPHKQKCYKEWNERSFPITEQIHQEELSLPINQVLTPEEYQYITEIINKWNPKTKETLHPI